MRSPADELASLASESSPWLSLSDSCPRGLGALETPGSWRAPGPGLPLVSSYPSVVAYLCSIPK